MAGDRSELAHPRPLHRSPDEQPPLTWALSLAVAVGGAFWAWHYQRSGSLVGPWLGHLLVDAAIFAIGWELVR